MRLGYSRAELAVLLFMLGMGDFLIGPFEIDYFQLTNSFMLKILVVQLSFFEYIVSPQR